MDEVDSTIVKCFIGISIPFILLALNAKGVFG